MLKYLIIVLGDSSASFCHYEGKKKANAENKLISFEHLENAVVFALKNNLKINFLYPDFGVNKKFDKLINDVEHVKIIPFKLHNTYRDSIIVVKSDDIKSFISLKSNDENIILWLRYEEVSNLYSYVKKLIPKCKRINLVVQDIEKFTEIKLDEYSVQLEKISDILLKQNSIKGIPEMNFLTDRLFLEKMNNCEAGLTHLTIAPNGKVYLCPAFYYDNINNNYGDIKNSMFFKNKHLLELKYSPVCRICDAYHCKRCVFLNKKLTSEINIPSWQQCRISHTEREASRNLLNKLKQENKIDVTFNEIKELEYNDPFVIAEKNKQSISEFKNIPNYGKENK